MCKEVSLSNYLDLYRKCIDHSRSCTKNSPRFDPNFHLYIPGVPTSSGQDFSKKGEKIVKVCLHFSFTLQITLQFDELFVVPISCDFDINPEFVGTPSMNLKILSSLSRISRSHFCCMVSFSDQSRGTKSLSLPRHEFSNITRCASE